METTKEKFWFPAKTYGYGWGPPICWQGWLVMVIYAAALATCALVFLPDKRTSHFLVGTFSLTFVLIFVCWLKGERPRWRWGKDQK